MTLAKTFKTLALASTCLAPLSALAQTAQSSGEAAVGAEAQSANSALYGRYNGDWD